jgi:hypothetical protein
MQYVPLKPTHNTKVLLTAHAASHQPLDTEAQVKSQAIPRGICGEQIGTGTGFSPSTTVLLYQHNSTNAQFSFSRSSLMQYRL